MLHKLRKRHSGAQIWSVDVFLSALTCFWRKKIFLLKYQTIRLEYRIFKCANSKKAKKFLDSNFFDRNFQKNFLQKHVRALKNTSTDQILAVECILRSLWSILWLQKVTLFGGQFERYTEKSENASQTSQNTFRS